MLKAIDCDCLRIFDVVVGQSHYRYAHHRFLCTGLENLVSMLFAAKDVVKRIAEVLRDHKQHGDVVTEACVLVRTLTLDDDPRVPFSKAHDHAKMIVTEANALDLLLEIAKSMLELWRQATPHPYIFVIICITFCWLGYSDEAVLGEIFATLGRLAVRNEFCQRIADLGGLQLMLTVMKENLDNKVILFIIFMSIALNFQLLNCLSLNFLPRLSIYDLNCQTYTK